MVHIAQMENLREIVNGKLLAQFVGRKISIIGLVTSSQTNFFEIRTVDDVSVKILLKNPLSEPIEGYVEVIGTSQGHTVACDEIIKGDLEDEEEFDVAAHNSAAMLLNACPRLWEME